MAAGSSQASVHQLISVILSVILPVILMIISEINEGASFPLKQYPGIVLLFFFKFIICQQADYTSISEVSV